MVRVRLDWFFFFSSRRRHTRCSRDWSSDVCSSDLNTILTVNLAPTDSNVIWVGTDDGLVQVTRDGGKTWSNVSGHFPGLTKDVEGRVYQIGVSPFDAGAAYIAIDRHQLDDPRPYVFKTSAF